MSVAGFGILNFTVSVSFKSAVLFAPAKTQGRNEVYGIKYQKMGSGIRRVGYAITNKAPGSGIATHGIEISSFSEGSGVRICYFCGPRNYICHASRIEDHKFGYQK